VENLAVDVEGIGSGGNNCFDDVALTIHERFQTIKHSFGSEHARDFSFSLPENVILIDPSKKEEINGEEVQLVQSGVLLVPE
jgi:hypothetical protein